MHEMDPLPDVSFNMRGFRLNTGQFIPAVGLGTVNFTSSSDEVTAAVLQAIQIGYRHIDTAKYYGTEAAIGKALDMAFQSGLVRREDMFITSKLWCDDNSPDDVKPALLTSLNALQLDYLDLYLMHFPVRFTKGARIPPKEREFLPLDLQGSWRAMEQCAYQGLTKAIGVSNFSTKKLADLLEYAELAPAVNQVEMHPIWQQKKLREFCESKGVHVSAWSPLGAPGTKYGSCEVLDHPAVQGIATRHGRSRGQIVLKWGVQSGVSVLPKSYNLTHQLENINIFDWQLTSDDLNVISQLQQKRLSMCEYLCDNTSSPYKTIQELWDGEV